MQPIRSNDHEVFRILCKKAGLSLTRIEPMAGAGSWRRYYRLFLDQGKTVIGTIGVSAAENAAFCYLTGLMTELQLPVPHILCIADDQSAYIQTDLGDVSLFDVIEPGRKNGQWEGAPYEALKKAVESLPAMQFEPTKLLDKSRCMQPVIMDKGAVLRDLNYFKYCFLKPLDIQFDEVEMDSVFAYLTDMVLKSDTSVPEAFTLRDCQSRNVMIDADGNPYWIDYQGGRIAPVTYDLASLLWQTRARIPAHIRSQLVDHYYNSMLRYAPGMLRSEFDESLKCMVLIRMLQVLGAYGLRGLIEGKVQFIESIPGTLDMLLKLLGELNNPFMGMLQQVIECAATHPWCKTDSISTDSPLIVDVCSFSYKRGMPRYRSHHGGGFVFDCRAPHNPGRFDKYKAMTGLDNEVIEYIENDGELPQLVQHATAMVGAAVERYKERGFNSLAVAFGCTGGRHRSVYGAEHLAAYINTAYNVTVRVSHTNIGVNYILEPKS